MRPEKPRFCDKHQCENTTFIRLHTSSLNTFIRLALKGRSVGQAAIVSHDGMPICHFGSTLEIERAALSNGRERDVEVHAAGMVSIGHLSQKLIRNRPIL